MPCMTRVPQDNERSKTPARSSTSMRRAHGRQTTLQKQRLSGTIWTRWCLSSHHEHARMQRTNTHEKRDERACPHTPTRDANARACECAKHHGTQLSCSMSTHTHDRIAIKSISPWGFGAMLRLCSDPSRGVAPPITLNHFLAKSTFSHLSTL